MFQLKRGQISFGRKDARCPGVTSCPRARRWQRGIGGVEPFDENARKSRPIPGAGGHAPVGRMSVVFSVLHVPEFARRLLRSGRTLRENPSDTSQGLSYPAIGADEDLLHYDRAIDPAGCRFAGHHCGGESAERVRYASAGAFLTPAITS